VNNGNPRLSAGGLGVPGWKRLVKEIAVAAVAGGGSRFGSGIRLACQQGRGESWLERCKAQDCDRLPVSNRLLKNVTRKLGYKAHGAQRLRHNR